MLHLYFGSDLVAARAAAFSLATDMNLPIVRIETETYIPRQIANAVRSVSLFGDMRTYIIDMPSQLAEMNGEVLACAPEMKGSTETFIVIEGALLAAPKKKWLALADQYEEFTRGQQTRFDVFKMAEALLRRDKKSLWLFLSDARKNGLSAEEIIGTLWWQLKTLRLAAATKDAAKAGMKDFTYNKAKRSLVNFKAGEIDDLSRRLLAVYHDGHGGVKDIDIGLEEWVLSI